MAKQKRKRGYTVQINYNYEYNATGISEEDWREKITNRFLNIYENEKVNYLAFAFHDKDIKNGEPAGLHVHMVIRFINPRYQKAVMELVGATRAKDCQQTSSFAGSTQYLLHATETAVNKTLKHIYDQDIIISRGINPRELMNKDTSSKTEKERERAKANELIAKIMDGEMILQTAIDEFEDEFNSLKAVQYTSRFEKAEQNFARRKAGELKDMNERGEWERITSYICGPGQSGKSRLAVKMASAYADDYGVHNVAGGGGRGLTDDIVDGYANEKVAVIDDVRSETFESRDFFKMFDRNNWSMSKSRNNNKPWFVERVYLTSNESLNKFLLKVIFYSSTRYQKEPYDRNKVKELDEEEELNGRSDTIEQVRMIARRVQRYMKYDFHEDGTPIVRLFRIVEDYPTIDDLRNYSKKHLNGAYDERIFDLFYEEIAYIPYDNSFENNRQFESERNRIADLALKVFNGEKGVSGVVDSYEPTKLSILRLESERQEKRELKKKEQELAKISELKNNFKIVEQAKEINQEDFILRKKKNELLEDKQNLLRIILNKLDNNEKESDELNNPFLDETIEKNKKAEKILEEFEKIIDDFV